MIRSHASSGFQTPVTLGRPKLPVSKSTVLLLVTSVCLMILVGRFFAITADIHPSTTTQVHPPSLSDVLPNLLNVSFDIPCKAYYINMDGSRGRRAVIERTFGKLWGPKLVRVPAVNGKDRQEVSSCTGEHRDDTLAF